MKELKYQEALLKRLNTYSTLNAFPKSNLLIGESGSGKHLLTELISNKYYIDILDITLNITKERIDELYTSPLLKLCIIDIEKLIASKRYKDTENKILKLVEEPPESVILFILTPSLDYVLNTIQNRCLFWELTPYTTKELKTFNIYTDEIYHILTTPGQVLNGKDETYYKDLLNICYNIITNINKASIPNTLSLQKHINFANNDDSLYDVGLFYRAFKYTLYKTYLINSDSKIESAYKETLNVINRNKLLNVDKYRLFCMYILKIKRILSI